MQPVVRRHRQRILGGMRDSPIDSKVGRDEVIPSDQCFETATSVCNIISVIPSFQQNESKYIYLTFRLPDEINDLCENVVQEVYLSSYHLGG